MVPDETGDPGEIQVRGANLFSGYWPDGADGPDADGWWSHRRRRLRRRRAATCSSSTGSRSSSSSPGFNVYPVEVERVVAEVDGVADVAVIGVADDETGEAVVAYVVAARPPTPPPSRPPYARPASATWPASRCRAASRSSTPLPHGITGKVQKGRLRGLERRRALGLLE